MSGEVSGSTRDVIGEEMYSNDFNMDSSEVSRGPMLRSRFNVASRVNLHLGNWGLSFAKIGIAVLFTLVILRGHCLLR